MSDSEPAREFLYEGMADDPTCENCLKRDFKDEDPYLALTGMPLSMISHWIPPSKLSLQSDDPSLFSLRSHYVKLVRPGEASMSDILKELMELLDAQRKMNEKNCQQS